MQARLRETRNATAVRLEILACGVGEALKRTAWSAEEVRAVFESARYSLPEAIRAAIEAEEAFDQSLTKKHGGKKK